MSVLIGHASIDEKGKIKGGSAGDQTGKELCIRNWYNKPWTYVLRCIDPIKAELMARACEAACDNNFIGYDQNQRNTLRNEAIKCGYDLKRIAVPCECDCSSFMAVCAECAGIKVTYSGSNAPTTQTMKSAFLNTGLFESITDRKMLSSCNQLKRGDILVAVGQHTVMVLEEGSQVRPVSSKYVVGKTYILINNLYIRMDPYGSKLKYDCITQNAKSNAKYDEYGYAILQSGTRVTCKEVKEARGSVWIRIPSGWICARNEEGKIYIE